MTPVSLIATARDLVETGRGRPRQSNLCRAVSTTYYAMFHCLATCCADTLVGSSSSSRDELAWQQAYRALDHGTARRRCMSGHLAGRFCLEIREFADKFVDLQEKRNQADYAPANDFSKETVTAEIETALGAIRRFQRIPLKDRRAFAVYVLLNLRGSQL